MSISPKGSSELRLLLPPSPVKDLFQPHHLQWPGRAQKQITGSGHAGITRPEVCPSLGPGGSKGRATSAQFVRVQQSQTSWHSWSGFIYVAKPTQLHNFESMFKETAKFVCLDKKNVTLRTVAYGDNFHITVIEQACVNATVRL